MSRVADRGGGGGESSSSRSMHSGVSFFTCPLLVSLVTLISLASGGGGGAGAAGLTTPPSGRGPPGLIIPPGGRGPLGPPGLGPRGPPGLIPLGPIPRGLMPLGPGPPGLMPGLIPGLIPGDRTPGGPPLIRTIPLGLGPPLPRIGDPGVAPRIGDPGVAPRNVGVPGVPGVIGMPCPGSVGLTGEAMPGGGVARRACGLIMAGLGTGARREAGLARRTPRPEVPATAWGAIVFRGEDTVVARRIIVVAIAPGWSRLPRG